MKVAEFLARVEIANNYEDYADSLILIYTDTCDVIGPFVSREQQCNAYDRAASTGRPFKFETWNVCG